MITLKLMAAMQKPNLTLAGWGNYPKGVASFSQPEQIRYCRTNEHSIIPRGLGRSYGDAAMNTDRHVILMSRMNRFLNFDDVTGVLKAEAGVTLADILTVFAPQGWFPPVTPGTKFVTLGGCVASDVYGKNHHQDGSFGSFVKELELLLPDGTRKRCSGEINSELFWATIGGLGLTGLITEVTLQMLPISSSYMKVQHIKAKNLEAVLQILDESKNQEKYSVAWIDCQAKGKRFGRSVVMLGEHASPDEVSAKEPFMIPPRRKLTLPSRFPSWMINSTTIRAFNQIYYSVQGAKKRPFLLDYDRYFYPSDAIQGLNRIYGSRGFVQYQFVVPPETAHDSMKAILSELGQTQRGSFLAVLKRLGSEGQGHLSFPKEGYTLSLDLPIVGNDLFQFLDDLDEIVLKYEGRVYLAKDARLKRESFKMMYPRYEEWLAIKQQVDPRGIYSSDLSRRLMGGSR